MKTLVKVGPHRLDTLSIVVIGFMMALQLILSRLTLGTQFIRLSATFLVVALMAMWFGALWAGIAAALTDVIGVFMTGGTYFIGFTISAVLAAVLYGLFFYEQRVSWPRVLIVQLIITILINTVLNTLWLTLLYRTPFWGLLPVRGLKELITYPLQVILIYWIGNNQTIQSIRNRL